MKCPNCKMGCALLYERHHRDKYIGITSVQYGYQCGTCGYNTGELGVNLTQADAQARACLHGLAPEMLEALEEAETELRHECTERQLAVADVVSAVIAKVEGK